MNAALITAGGAAPAFGTFREPVSGNGELVIAVRASALSHLSKMRASGSHYSSDGVFPSVPGVDGVGITPDGRRVYFAMPEAPFGALAEFALVEERRCIAVPDALEDVQAAALPNAGMSSWAALVERAKFIKGETVLINGATGSSGSLAVQIAKYLGAARVIVTGRNREKLEALRALGADEVIAFDMDASNGAQAFEAALTPHLQQGVDVVLDYLWGSSALTIITAIARAVDDARPVRFVQIGSAAGDATIALPSAALRSSAITLMGSGLKSVPMPKLFDAIRGVYNAAAEGALHMATTTAPLTNIAEAWNAPGEPRMVITVAE